MGFDFGGSSGSRGGGGTAPKPPKVPTPPKPPRRSGFGSKPILGSGSSYRPGTSSGGGLKAPRQPNAPRAPRTSFSMPDIPWEIVLGIVAGLGIIALLWANRDAITAFLTELLTWIILIVVGLLLLRYAVFGRFTRRR